ncbi:hypothetical protein [Leptothrix discophora]|uniref:Uncharacterized protein n=1 Tax=Leptothrix discophora TaxID=89 RepID=A0ABT9FZQ9_LEPDI|nr:hypothetical protein [Leptothrix discophora]MDP4299706.1 hypothetical protein [Leptothrix discophora]
MEKTKYSPQPATLQHANARMLNRYMPWMDYMLTITLGKTYDLSLEPTYEQARDQLRHLGRTLNSAVWGNRSKYNDKCQVLYIPAIEGAVGNKRIHAHILIGNVKSRAELDAHLRSYIPRSHWLLPRYDVAEIHDGDGIAFYVAKETAGLNQGAIDWQLASIPKPLMP